MCRKVSTFSFCFVRHVSFRSFCYSSVILFKELSLFLGGKLGHFRQTLCHQRSLVNSLPFVLSLCSIMALVR